MIKLTGIVWQSYYNGLFKASRKVKNLKVKLYSARILEESPEKLKEAFKELEKSDILFFYRSNESFWEKLERDIKNRKFKGKIVCLGNDPGFWKLSTVSSKILEKACRYLLINGEKNLINFFLFLGKEAGGLNISYEEPEEVPWEGIYHPKADKIFRSVEEYLNWYGETIAERTVGILFSRHYWINGNTEVEDALIEEFEARGLKVIPAFTYSLKDSALGTKGSGEVVLEYFLDKQEKPRISALVKLVCFFLGSKKGEVISNKTSAEEGVEILKKLNVPVFSPVSSYYKTIEEWEREELNLDIGWSIALPEFEGVIEPIIISAQVNEKDDQRKRMPIKDRVKKLVDRIERWIELRNTPPSERRIAFVLHNNPCASVEATVGSAAHLDSLESVVEIMKKMKKEGYRVEPPENGKALIEKIMKKKAISEFRWTTVEEIVEKGGAIAFVDKEKYLEWFNELPEKAKKKMIEAWGNPPGEYRNGIPPAMLYKGKIVITGLKFGNVVVCVQPKRGCAGARCDGRVCKILHDPDVPPPHQYIATYKWLSREFKAHAIVHVGTHGNLEFLPGKGIALSSACFPDIAIDTVPHLYIYNADNPPEGTIAKRRSYAVLVDHMQTVMTEAGLYGELAELEKLLEEYENAKRKDPARLHLLEHMILDAIKKAKLDEEIVLFLEEKKKKLCDLSCEEVHKVFEKVVEEVHSRLSLIRNSQIQDGMHIFGKPPEGEKRIDFIYAILKYDAGEKISLRKEIARLLGYELNILLENPEKVDKKTGRSYGAILEEIDKLAKEIIKIIITH